MSEIYCAGIEDFLVAVENASEGDCICIDGLSVIALNSKVLLDRIGLLCEKKLDLFSSSDGIDTRKPDGKAFFRVCSLLSKLDRQYLNRRRREGIEKAKADGNYKGRKPISVDEGLFDSVVALWKEGKITARQAMTRLNLKPNTFYRRIKRREEEKMTEFKKAGHDIREEIKEAARQSRKDLDDLKKEVKAEAREVKKAADEKLEIHDVEREIRRERIKAEIEHVESVKQLKKDVEYETKELKKLVEEE